jgi:formamidopyrimidine-DNA glycosylase
MERPRQIKAMLMDQRTIAGLGNIYCDEALHAAGVHPLRRACDVEMDQRNRLLRSIKDVLRRAIRHKGTTLMDYRSIDGQSGSFQRYHKVYQREGKPCRACGTMIERLLAAGRSTFICPRCQPEHD